MTVNDWINSDDLRSPLVEKPGTLEDSQLETALEGALQAEVPEDL